MRKRTITLTILLCVLALTAFANVSITFDSSRPVEEQVMAFKAYLAALDPETREVWFKEIDILASDRRTVFSMMAQEGGADVVFISKGGAKYHENNMCRGLKFTETLSAITKDAAKEMKRTPCKFCYPQGDNP